MRTTVNLSEDLLAKAEALTGIKGRTELIQEGLAALIQRESARRLALLGGSDPSASVARKREAADDSR